MKFLGIAATVALGLFLVFLIGFYVYLRAVLPRVDRLADYSPPIVSQVFGDNGTLVGEFYLERRSVVPVSHVPRRLIQAFVAAEDSSFYQHKGIDYLGILRAAFKNVISLSKKEGASTITQQVAKSMLLTPEKSYSRKIKEAILAKRMEDQLTKDEILYIYLNQIYLGGGSYGVQVASETYFDKDVENLNLAEMAMLAGLPKAPNTYSPIKHLDRAKERQRYVLERMVKEGYITEAEAEHARNTPIVIRSRKKVNSEQSAYFLEYLRIQLEAKYGEEQLYRKGLKIFTTMNAEMQRAAWESVTSGLKAVDKRQGFRGPLKYLKESELEWFFRQVEEGIDTASLKQGATYRGVVTGVNPGQGSVTVRVGDRTGTLDRKTMAWAGKLELIGSFGNPGKGKEKALAPGAVIEVSVVTPDANKSGALFALDQEPIAQAALIALDPRSGAIKAMMGGYDFKKSQYNRALQAKRNPGSAFKPIIYAAALDKGLTPATLIDDSPVEYPGGIGKTWAPRNYDGIYRGPVTMREALTNSINMVSIKILDTIGVNYAVEYAKKLGITSPLSDNLTLALGASSVTPLELTNAYATFASGGYRLTPFAIIRVTDRNGQVLEEITPPTIPVFAPLTSAAIQPPPPEGTLPPLPGAVQNQPPASPAQPGSETVAQCRQSPAIASALLPVPVISPETAFVITSLMQSVVQSGTGRRALAVGRPVAAKTGTTNDMKDAWFVGFIPQLVAGVWVGYDQERSLGAGGSGGQAAAPIWTEFMQKAVAGLPVEQFKAPANVSSVFINPATGRLVPDGSPGSVREYFISGTEPKRYDGDGR